MIASDPPPPLRDRRPDVPEPLQALVLKCLAKLPSERFADVGQLMMALLPFAPEECRWSAERAARRVRPVGVSSAPDAGADQVGVQADGTTRSSWGKTTGARNSRASLTVGIGVAVLAVAGFGTFAWLRATSPAGLPDKDRGIVAVASAPSTPSALVTVEPMPVESATALGPQASSRLGAAVASARGNAANKGHHKRATCCFRITRRNQDGARQEGSR